MQNAAKFVFAQRQALGNDQSRSQHVRSDRRNFFNVGFPEGDERESELVLVPGNQHFRADDTRLLKGDIQLSFLIRINGQRFALFEGDVFQNFADALRLIGEQLPARGGVFRFQHVFAVVSDLAVDGVQNAALIDAGLGQTGGNIDEAGLTLRAADVDELVQFVFQSVQHAGAVIRTGFADALDDASAYVFFGALLRFVCTQSRESGLDFPEYARNFKQLFPDCRAVAVDGDARKVLFPIKDQFVFHLSDERRGNEQEKQGRNEGG